MHCVGALLSPKHVGAGTTPDASVTVPVHPEKKLFICLSWHVLATVYSSLQVKTPLVFLQSCS